MQQNTAALDKKAKIQEYLDYHRNNIRQAVGTAASYFYPKVPFMNNGIRVIGMFKSELEIPDRIFLTEMVSRSFTPLNEARTLYKMRHNPFFKNEYAVEGERYFVPIDELEVVWQLKSPLTESRKEISIPEDKLDLDKDDSNISELTIRDLAAILMQKPVSNKTWLNNLVTAQ
jgi:hypothetical protein